MRRIWVLLAMVLVVVLIGMALTKPDDVAHFAEMKRVARSEVGRQLAASQLTEEYAAMLSVVVMGKVNSYVDRHLTVYDYFFFTLGTMRHQGMSVPATLGTFNKVFFIVDEDEVRKAAAQKFKIPQVDIKNKEDMKKLKDMKDLKDLKDYEDMNE